MSSSRTHGRAALSMAALAAALAATTPAHALVVEAGPVVGPTNGHSYYLLARDTWIAAEAEAVARGGHLVAIGDAAANAWVWNTFSAIAGAPFWIGLTDVAQEGTFVWTNGEPLVYTSWWTAGGEPNNAGGVERARRPTENRRRPLPPTSGRRVEGQIRRLEADHLVEERPAGILVVG